jgi:hypothetical protein
VISQNVEEMNETNFDSIALQHTDLILLGNGEEKERGIDVVAEQHLNVISN